MMNIALSSQHTRIHCSKLMIKPFSKLARNVSIYTSAVCLPDLEV
jgi:hypothetical protein